MNPLVLLILLIVHPTNSISNQYYIQPIIYPTKALKFESDGEGGKGREHYEIGRRNGGEMARCVLLQNGRFQQKLVEES